MGNPSTGLPPEIISEVLQYLRPPALRRCLRVNSAFNALVQRPLAACVSGYVVADGRGVAYPHIKDTGEEQEQQPGLLRRPTRGRVRPVPKDIRCLTVAKHERCNSQTRKPFASSTGTPRINSCAVLQVILASPNDRDHFASPHSVYYPRALTAYPESDGEPFDYPEEEAEYMCVEALECQLLHFALEDATVTKLVLKDVPLVYGNVDPDLLFMSASQTIEEAVIVYKMWSMSASNDDATEDWYYHGDGEPICLQAPERLAYPAQGSIGSAIPPNVKSLTLVFWLRRPGDEVTPLCCRVPDPWDCWSDDDEDGDDGTSETEDGHESCWEGGVWRDLAVAVAPLLLHKLDRVTIVNASSIVPTGEPPQATLELISDGLAKHDIVETKLRVQLYDHLRAAHNVSTDGAEELVSRVKFMYVKEWLLQSDWEDVFTWFEVRPWLEFKAPARITDYFKPTDSEGVKWRRDMDEAERFHLKNLKQREAKPGKNT